MIDNLADHGLPMRKNAVTLNFFITISGLAIHTFVLCNIQVYAIQYSS